MGEAFQGISGFYVFVYRFREVMPMMVSVAFWNVLCTCCCDSAVEKGYCVVKRWKRLSREGVECVFSVLGERSPVGFFIVCVGLSGGLRDALFVHLQ